MDKSYISFKTPGISGVVLKTGSDCVFDPVSLLGIPDIPEYNCKKGKTVQAGADGVWFVKRYCHRNIIKMFCHIFQRPRPLNCLLGAKTLRENGIDTPVVFAALRKRRGIMLEFDYLITADISNGTVFADKMPLTQELAGELVKILAEMHDAGIAHGDTSLRNIYRRASGVWGVIDLDACRIGSKMMKESLRRKDLTRLASSFFKLASERNEPIIETDIAGMFAGLYKKYSGFDLDSAAYRKRIAYLAERKRK